MQSQLKEATPKPDVSSYTYGPETLAIIRDTTHQEWLELTDLRGCQHSASTEDIAEDFLTQAKFLVELAVSDDLLSDEIVQMALEGSGHMEIEFALQDEVEGRLAVSLIMLVLASRLFIARKYGVSH